MKRFGVLILILAFLVPIASAEIPSVSELTLDELYLLRRSIDEEVAKRTISGSDTIYVGRYVVGRDILSGLYLLTPITLIEDKNYLYVAVYNKKSSDEADHYYWDEDLYLGETAFINLAEGMIFEVGNGVATIQPTSKPAWAP